MHTRPITCHLKRACFGVLSLLCVLWQGRPYTAFGKDKPGAAHTSDARLPACTTLVPWLGALPQASAESARYGVAVDGLSVGTVDFQIARTGQFAGKPVVEYRSLFKLDHLLATMANIEGRAAALVPLDAASPQSAMSHYSIGDTLWHEELAFTQEGRQMTAVRKVSPAPSRMIEPDKTPDVAQPIIDFVTGYYLIRRLPADASACMTVYANQHHYVVWASPEGSERIQTPIGVRAADVFGIQYQRISGSIVGSGRIWLSQTEERLPYQIAIAGDRRIEARLHTYVMGRSPTEIKRPCSDASD